MRQLLLVVALVTIVGCGGDSGGNTCNPTVSNVDNQGVLTLGCQDGSTAIGGGLDNPRNSGNSTTTNPAPVATP